jgi:hypothetical protein
MQHTFEAILGSFKSFIDKVAPSRDKNHGDLSAFIAMPEMTRCGND